MSLLVLFLNILSMEEKIKRLMNGELSPEEELALAEEINGQLDALKKVFSLIKADRQSAVTE